MKKKLLAAALVVMLLAVGGCSKKTEVTLGEYKGLTLIKVSQATVEEQIESVLEENASKVEVTRPAQQGDTVNINFTGYLDGVAFDGGTVDDEEGMDLLLGSHSLIDGFEDGLVGASAGETVNLSLTFPDPYEKNPDLAGKPVIFVVTVNSVKETVVPELTDEFVRTVSDYDTVAEYRQSVEDDLNLNSFYAQVQNAILTTSSAKNLPEDRVKEEKESFVSFYTYYAQLYSSYYGMDVDTILQLIWGVESLDALNEEGQAYAEQAVTFSLCIEEIAKQEGLEVTDTIFAQKTADYAKDYGYEDTGSFIEAYGEDTIRDQILVDLVVELCIDQATIVNAAE